MLQYLRFLVLLTAFCVCQNAYCWQDNKEDEKFNQSIAVQEQLDKETKELINRTDITIPEAARTPALPKRPDVQFGTSDERITLPLFQVDARLVELKFAAQVDLQAEPISRPGDTGINFSKAEEMFPDPRIGLTVMSQMSQRVGIRRDNNIQIDGLSELLRAVNERSNTEMSLDDFRDKIAFHFRVMETNDNSVRWFVLGATQEETQKDVQRLLQIYDAIWTAYQQRVTEIANQIRDQISQRLATFSSSCEAYDSVRENWIKVREYEDISEVSRTDLKTQRQLTDVDLAGINAKIDACEKLLEKLTGTSADEVIRIKTTAEIDLVEKTARRAKLDDLIKKSEMRAEAADELLTARNRVKDAAAFLRGQRDGFKRVVEFQKQLQPMPVMNSLVKVRPLEWRNVNQ